jgi:hypothetical protein
MYLLKRYKSYFDTYLMIDHHNQIAINVFCKSLYIFLLLKLFFIREILVERLQNSFLSGFNDVVVYVFVGVIIGVLLTSLFLRVNYVSSFLIFAVSFSASRTMAMIANGSDLVLNLFLFLSIFLSVVPRFKKSTLAEGQLIIRNFFFLICRVQLALIYLLSGFDKITSEAWRSGDAIFSIINLDFFFSPLISIALSKTEYLLIAWTTIIFELSFAFLIWIRKFRFALLCLGIIFHLGIVFLLSLPDFGIVMILLYSLFIPFERLGKQSMPVVSGGS